MENQSLTFKVLIDAPATAVYRAFTNAAALTQWLCNDARVNATEGGSLYLHWQQGYSAIGTFTTLSEAIAIAFAWQGQGDPAPTSVTVSLAPTVEGTAVTLIHGGIGNGETWQETASQIQERWEMGLTNLKSVLEEGVDKRVYDLPFMGILPNAALTAEQAAAQGAQAKGAISLSGVVAGTGAAAVGLMADDLMVELGETETLTYADLGKAVAGRKVGDELPLIFYRAGQRHEKVLRLGRRPTPNVPDSPADFAAALEETYADINLRLDHIFAGVSDVEAGRPPAEGEWSALDVLAHLIITERVAQVSRYFQLSDQPSVGYPNNTAAPLQAVRVVYPTVALMLEAWKRTAAETAALVAALPDEFVARRLDYLNLGQTLLLALPAHTRSHFAQMEGAITAARQD